MATIFEKAARKKLRFKSHKGFLNTEDLWDLSLGELDDLAMGFNSKIESAGRTSFVKKTSDVPENLDLSFKITKHIIDVRLAEAEAAEEAATRKQQKEKILSIIAAKEDKNLEKKSLSDLRKMVEDM